MKILVVDDEALLVTGIRLNLQNEGYEVITGSNGAEAVLAAQTQEPDLIILDVMMPEMDGLEACTRIREFSQVPIIMLTAKADDMDKLMGFEQGADDYLTKPFAAKELLARIRAMTRNSAVAVQSDSKLHVGNITLDCATFELSSPFNSFTLANKEFQMIELLMRNPRQIISAEQFMDKIWGFDANGESNVVWTYISYLRKKLVALKADVEIRARRGAGYSLEEI